MVVDINIFYIYIEGAYIKEPKVLVYIVVVRGIGGIS